jgi:hypothetical protein
MLAGYNVRIQIQKCCILFNIAEFINFKIDKDNKGGFKTAYVPMTICAYQVIIKKTDKKAYFYHYILNLLVLQILLLSLIQLSLIELSESNTFFSVF